MYESPFPAPVATCFRGSKLHAYGFVLSGGHHPQGVGVACASTIHAWGVGLALPSEKHASCMQHMLLFSVFFRPDHSSKVDIFGTRRTFFFCVVHVTFARLYTTRKYALRTANILGRLPKYRFAVLNPCWCIERTYRLYRRGNLLEYQTVIAPSFQLRLAGDLSCACRLSGQPGFGLCASNGRHNVIEPKQTIGPTKTDIAFSTW